MFYIFGWGKQTRKNIGPIPEKSCDNCNTDQGLVLTKVTTWITLFYIPLGPYDTKYFLSCPVCKNDIPISYKQAEELAPIAKIHRNVIRRGNDIQVDMDLTRDELIGGVNKEVVLSKFDPCDACRGTGVVSLEMCKICHGDGVARANRILSVRVPAGVEDGNTLRVRGAGEAVKNGRSGDLYVRLHVKG